MLLGKMTPGGAAPVGRGQGLELNSIGRDAN